MTGRGGGGAKGGGQGEREPMPHVPDIRAGKACHRRRSAYGRRRGQPSIIRGGSRMQESCTYGSVRGRPVMGGPTAIATVGGLAGPRYAIQANRRDRIGVRFDSLQGGNLGPMSARPACLARALGPLRGWRRPSRGTQFSSSFYGIIDRPGAQPEFSKKLGIPAIPPPPRRAMPSRQAERK